jgi:hypothetical protein
MKLRTEIPAAVHICERCGELASGDACESCRSLQWDATRLACSAIAGGALSMEVIREPGATKAELLFADLADAEFHRLRTAFLNERIPSTRGLQPEDDPMPVMFRTWKEAVRALAIYTGLSLSAAVLFWLVLL